MHTDFAALRAEAPMNLGRDGRPKTLSAKAQRDLDRVQALWRDHRAPDGPFFFGAWSIADAFWTPLATRVASYAIDVEPAARAYVDVLLADPVYLAWREDARAETHRVAATEDA
jgi:glutathione S-transferase